MKTPRSGRHTSSCRPTRRRSRRCSRTTWRSSHRTEAWRATARSAPVRNGSSRGGRFQAMRMLSLSGDIGKAYGCLHDPQPEPSFAFDAQLLYFSEHHVRDEDAFPVARSTARTSRSALTRSMSTFASHIAALRGMAGKTITSPAGPLPRHASLPENTLASRRLAPSK
jgi:hypothetical protein